MRNKRFICLALCLLLTLQASILAFAEGESTEASSSPTENSVASTVTETQSQSGESLGNLSVQGGSHSIDGQSPILGTGQLIKNAVSVILYETKTETLMYSWNADQQLYPASLVKIMTALIVEALSGEAGVGR